MNFLETMEEWSTLEKECISYISSFFLENISWKFNLNLFIAVIIKGSIFLNEFCNQMQQAYNYF